MVRYNEDIIEEVISNNDIVDIVSQYVSLKKSGRNFLGLCPFHKEKTPSFSVSPDKQIFHCFGCGVGGNVIHFLSKIESITFRESLETLADKAGIVLPTIDTGKDAKFLELKDKIYQINKDVAEFYNELLYKPEAKEAQNYVKKRKLGNKTLLAFQIGYAPNNNTLYNFLKEKGYADEEIFASALVKKRNNSYLDSFKNRLMFPIKDTRGRVIAFGGRVLDNSLPKYINSPDTPVYNKGKNLFGLNIAKDANLGSIIIVEGYMDCISLYQRGIINVVASLGTSLTESQARLLKRYSEKIIIAYDSDGAGQAATLRGLEILKNVGCDVRILQMDGAKDPDEYVIKYGSGKFNLLVENAISLVEFKVKVLRNSLNLSLTNDKIIFLKQVAKLLKDTNSKIEQEIYIEKIAKEYSISKEAIYAEMNKLNTNKVNNKVLEKNKALVSKQKQQDISNGVQKREDVLIQLLLSGNKEIFEQVKNKVSEDDLVLEVNKRIINKLYNELETEQYDINSFITLFNDDEEALGKITKLLSEQNGFTNNKKTIDNIINLYEKQKLTILKNSIIEQLNNEKDKEQIKILEKELSDVIIKLAKIK